MPTFTFIPDYMKKSFYFLLSICWLALPADVIAQSFSMKAVTSYPFPRELTSAAAGEEFAFTIEEQGKRNVYVASGPSFRLRKLTAYQKDDGQEITSLSISDNGQWVVYVKGGEHSGNWDRSVIVNPDADPDPPRIQIWSLPYKGGIPRLISEGDTPVISPDNKKIAFIKSGQVWIAPIDGSTPAKMFFNVRGNVSDIQWSPDGSKLAFVCNRTDHAFIGVYQNDHTPLLWLAPSFSMDASPRWSPDGKQVVFVRSPGRPEQAMRSPGGSSSPSRNGRADTTNITDTTARMRPWSIWIADATTGQGKMRWQSPHTRRGSLPTISGGVNLHWTDGGIVFLSYQDGWPHLYAIRPGGGQPLLLTPGDFMVEQVRLSSDGKWLIFSANTGPDTALDIDRRHIARVPVDKPAMEMLTSGEGLETYPVLSGDGLYTAMFSADARQPLMVAVKAIHEDKLTIIDSSLLPKDFPLDQMSIPQQVIFKSPDGTMLHAQLFKPLKAEPRLPAIVYVHGGPQRQMLLGWNHMDYYSIDYSLNQYLASMGFAVLSINYRNGIGYGYEFNQPLNPDANYMDVKAAGEWLAAQPWVDTARIGIYGGSAGGRLTATALARDSRLFKAGVVIHGGTRESFSKWTSPTLVIHGDDDRNVSFSAGISLINQLESHRIPYEYLVIPDDSHHWMKYANILKVNNAAADFLHRKLMMQ